VAYRLDSQKIVCLSKFSLGCLASLILLSGCASAPPKAVEEKTEPEQVYTVQAEKRQKPTSFSYIQKAKQQTPEQSRSFYIQAAKYAIMEGKDQEFVTQILNRIDVSRYNSVSQDIELTKALLFVENLDAANSVLRRLQQGNLPKQHRLALWIIKAQIESNQDQHINVVQTIFRIYDFHEQQLSSNDQLLLHKLLWRHITQIPDATLNQFQTDFGERSAAWISLAKIIRQDFNQPKRLPVHLKRWQAQFSALNQSPYMPQDLRQLLNVEPFDPKRIALLLPLTGKLSRQAQALRNGILAAINFDSDLTIQVLNTNKYSIEQIEQKIVESNIEFIIGPLEKDKVASLQQSQVLGAIPTLYLNIPNAQVVENNPLAYYFSLAPEDEIDQAVEFFVEHEYKKPAVIYADNSLGRRLSEQFVRQWQLQTDSSPETIAFKSKSKLGQAVENLLDVGLSKARIKEMETLFGNELETSPRSRADIDAVYVIANSQQTRLIKPFFDVNVSVFGNRLPIFASSRSYLVDETRAQKRDLNDLTFTEMPWLIQQNRQELHRIYAKVGEQQTQLKKLFAFGFDAVQLIYTIKQLEAVPSQTINGLTGKLSVQDNNRIKRALRWSQYKQGRIVALVEPR